MFARHSLAHVQYRARFVVELFDFFDGSYALTTHVYVDKARPTCLACTFFSIGLRRKTIASRVSKYAHRCTSRRLGNNLHANARQPLIRTDAPTLANMCFCSWRPQEVAAHAKETSVAEATHLFVEGARKTWPTPLTNSVLTGLAQYSKLVVGLS